MPDVSIASGGGGGRKYVIFTGYCLYVPRVLARVVGMCGPKGYGFSAALVINGVSILVYFGHFGLNYGIVFVL